MHRLELQSCLPLFFIWLHATFPSSTCLRILEQISDEDPIELHSYTDEELAQKWRHAARQFQERHGEKQKLLFVGGPPRAGTTLLMYFLSKSQEVGFSKSTSRNEATLEDWAIGNLPGMGSFHFYSECAESSFVSSEEVGHKWKTNAMASMFRAGFNLDQRILAMKVPPYAWGARALQAMFNETHDVKFLISVKHPLEIKPESYGCDPHTSRRKTVAKNLAQCYKSLFENVLPHLSNYKVVRFEDWFLQKQLPREIEKHVGIQHPVNIKYEGHSVVKFDELIEDTPTDDIWGDEELNQICHDCTGSDLVVDSKYFGACEHTVTGLHLADAFISEDDFLPRLGYHYNSVQTLSPAVLKMTKA